jgi:hypothetical protein
MLIALTVALAAGALLLMAISSHAGRSITVKSVSLVSAGAPLLVGLAASLWFLFRAHGSLTLPFFGDAAEKAVAAWMIAEGGRLYLDIYANHGPFNYLLAHAVYMVTDAKEMAPYRLLQWTLAALTAVALGASPILRGWRQRLLAAALLAAVLATGYPAWKGHELLYSAQAGLLFCVALSLLLLPLLARSGTPSWSITLGAMTLPAIIASGYPFLVPMLLLGAGVAVLLLAGGELHEKVARNHKPFVWGFATSTSAILIWMWLFADFPGYVAYHLYLNQVVYAAIIDFHPLDAFRQITRIADYRYAWAIVALAAGAIWMARLVGTRLAPASRRRSRVPLVAGALLIFAGLLYLNARDELGFKNAALQIVAAQLAIIMLVRWTLGTGPDKLRPARQLATFSAVLVTGLAIAVTALTPWVYPISEEFISRRQETARQERVAGAALKRRIDAVAAGGEPIQVLVFLPRWYLLTQRLPASGHYYYLPGQGEYDRNPILGRHIDLCRDLEETKPTVVLFEDYLFPDGSTFRDYASCTYRLIATGFEPVADPDARQSAVNGFPMLFVRQRDRLVGEP